MARGAAAATPPLPSTTSSSSTAKSEEWAGDDQRIVVAHATNGFLFDLMLQARARLFRGSWGEKWDMKGLKMIFEGC